MSAGGRGLVLAYHRVAEPGVDPHGLCVSPERFAQQLEVLCRAARPLALEELLARAREGRLPPRAVAVTFDDGYADNLWTARPLLERFGVPATVFVASGYVGAPREFWWDELERVVIHPPRLPAELRVRIAGVEHHWRLPDPSPPGEALHQRLGLLRELWARLHPLAGGARRAALEDIRRWAGLPQMVRESHRQLTPAEIVALAADGLVQIGAHTVTHPSLDLLSERRQRREIERSRDRLREITGAPVPLFSYPHGRYSRHAVRCLRECGFRIACTLAHRTIRSGIRDPLRVPRVIGYNWSGEGLERHLAGWLPG